MPGGLKVFQRFLRILLGVGRSFYKAPGVPCPRESRENAHILLCPAWPQPVCGDTRLNGESAPCLAGAPGHSRVWGHTAKRRIRAQPGRAWPQPARGDIRLNGESGPEPCLAGAPPQFQPRHAGNPRSGKQPARARARPGGSAPHRGSYSACARERREGGRARVSWGELLLPRFEWQRCIR